MLKYNPKCKVCQVCKTNTKLVNDIFNTSFFMRSSKASLMSVHKAYRDTDGNELFKYISLRNHVKKHQFLSQEDFTKRHLNQISNQAEQEIIKRTIQSKTVWDTLIEKGMEGVEDGSKKVEVSHLLRAAKDKSDWEMKQKDQQLAMMEMVFHFTSGENDQSVAYDRRFVEGKTVQDYNPADIPAGHSNSGADGSGSVHYPPTWDAVTSGPSPLPDGNQSPQDQDQHLSSF